jgi:putative ABC transport system permease protein
MRDIRYAVRALLSTPGLTLTALLVLALGTGATTAIFSVINGVLLRPLPFADPDRLVQFEPMGVLDFKDSRERTRSFESMVAFQVVNKNLQDAPEPERIGAVAAERGLFDVLGVQPLIGRTFAPTDGTTVAVVSEKFWTRRFGASAPLSDRKITLDGEPYTVIGIMPERFQFPYRAATIEIWIPAELPRTANRFQRIDVAIGRLKSDVTVDEARAELRTIGQTLERLYPHPGAMDAVTVIPLSEAVVGRSRPALLTLFGAVAMVLLIACANVTNLLLARSEVRAQDVAVRTALGAGRARLVRQYLTESIVLALGAGVAAVLIALGGTKLLVALAGAQLPRAVEIGLDWTVLLFLLAVSVTTGVAFGLVPALNATRVDVSCMLKDLGGRGSRGRGSAMIIKGLVIAEIALAFILLIGAGLLLRAFLHLENTPTGIVADRVLTVRMETRGLLPRQPSTIETADSRTSPQGQYFRSIEERVLHLPGVRAAGFVTVLPIERPGNVGSFEVAGRPVEAEGRRPMARLREVTPGYFRALGIPLRAGRLFTDRDPGAVVNEALVRQYFPGEDPIGRILDRGTIIGVVGDVRQSLRLPPEPEMYHPLAQTSYSAATLVVSAQTPPEALVGSLRAAIREVNANQAVFNIRTMDDVIAASHPELDLYLWLIGLFAGLALVLAMAGIYGVISYATAARRKEFGIRLALGADGGRLLRLVLAQGGVLIGAGLAVGIAGALPLARFLRAQLYDVAPTDPATFVVVGLVLACVAVAACLNPARRVMKLDPLTVLRCE